MDYAHSDGRTLEQHLNMSQERSRSGAPLSKAGTERHNETYFVMGFPARGRFGLEQEFGATQGSEERRLKCLQFGNSGGCF